MARIKDGVFGGFSGKVGNVIGVFRNGKYYIKSAPAHVKNPRTKEQQGNRNAFGLVSKLVSAVNPFIKQGFKNSQKTARGTAISVNMHSAVCGENPDVYIDFPHVKVARGVLVPPKAPTATFDDLGKLLFEWEDNSGEGNAGADDEAMLLVIKSEEKMYSVYKLKGAARSRGQDWLEIPSTFKEAELHAYMAFISKDKTLVSDSVYVSFLSS